MLYSIRDEEDDDTNTFDKSIKAAQDQETAMVSQMKSSILEGTIEISKVQLVA